MIKAMPKITQQEKDFLREYMSGVSPQEAWIHIFDPERKMKISGKPLTGEQYKERGRVLMKRKAMKMWLEYLKTVSTEQMIEDLYVGEIGFGDTKSSLNAAEKYLESQFAGKDVAQIFLHWLREIQAEIVIPCNGELERVKI